MEPSYSSILKNFVYFPFRFFGLFFFGSPFPRFDIWFIDSDVAVDLETNKLLPCTTTRDVDDIEEGTKLIEMLGSSLGVWFVTKLGTTKVEKNRWNLKFCEASRAPFPQHGF